MSLQKLVDSKMLTRIGVILVMVQVIKLMLRGNTIQTNNNFSRNDCPIITSTTTNNDNNDSLIIDDSRGLGSIINWQEPISNPPISTLEKQTAIVCAVSKYETPYIDEWVDYNLGIGFNGIYIYDNTDRYELEQWGIKQQLANRPIYVQPKTGPGKQCEAYYDCARKAIEKNITWVLFYDIDEFLVVKNWSTTNPYTFNVIDFAERYVKQGSLSLNFEVFGTAGKQAYEPIPVLNRFQLKVPRNYKFNSFVKSFVKLQDMDLTVRCKNPHRFPLRNGTHQMLTNNKTTFGAFNTIDTTDVASIYHILFKSYEEYISKRARGDAYNGVKGSKISEEWAINNIGPDQKPIPYGTIYDDTAWRILTSIQPKYKLYDSFTSNLQTSISTLAIPFRGVLNNASPDAHIAIQNFITDKNNNNSNNEIR